MYTNVESSYGNRANAVYLFMPMMRSDSRGLTYGNHRLSSAHDATREDSMIMRERAEDQEGEGKLENVISEQRSRKSCVNDIEVSLILHASQQSLNPQK